MKRDETRSIQSNKRFVIIRHRKENLEGMIGRLVLKSGEPDAFKKTREAKPRKSNAVGAMASNRSDDGWSGN